MLACFRRPLREFAPALCAVVYIRFSREAFSGSNSFSKKPRGCRQGFPVWPSLKPLALTYLSLSLVRPKVILLMNIHYH